MFMFFNRGGGFCCLETDRVQSVGKVRHDKLPSLLVPKVSEQADACSASLPLSETIMLGGLDCFIMLFFFFVRAFQLGLHR